MLYKSYIIENDINIIKQEKVLFCGENEGLKDEIKNKIKQNKSYEFINLNEEEILKNQNNFFNEINNLSLFQKEKVIIINNTSDKILNVISDTISKKRKQKIYLFSGVLDKRSKLRSFFEKEKECGCIICYPDNEITIRNKIIEKLKNFKGLTAQNINLIKESCKLDRAKLNNEIEKIKDFFINKNIEAQKLGVLLNATTNEDFNELKDQALNGNTAKTNKLLSETNIDPDKIILYLNIITARINALYEITKEDNISLEGKINKLKPPIFWKDKTNFTIQANKWTREKITKLINKNYKIEIQMKSNLQVKKDILMKKLMIDICNLANS